MPKPRNHPALLSNLAGNHLPPVALSVSSQYQFCVDAGAMAAAVFFHDLVDVGLHDHFACSMQVFVSSVSVGLAAIDSYPPATMQACIDAFAAGYLGRVQQELRLFRGESVGRTQAESDVRLFTAARTAH